MSQNYSNYILDLPTVTSQTDNGESKHPMSICSCSLCDSNSCFKIRNDLAPCTCDSCNPTKTCSRSSKCVFVLQSESKKDKPIPQQQIIWVPDKQNDNVLVKKLESELETKQRKEQEKEQKRSKERELKIDLLPERDRVQKKRSKKELTNKESFYRSTRNKNSDFDIRKSIRYRYKDTTDVKKREKYYEKCITQTESVAITIANKERERSKAELSAQIMNVPYQEFKDCLSLNKTRPDQSPFNNIISEIIKPDILTRLKEIYKACSCKVCECITGKPFSSNDNCKCKPCECNDCLNILKLSKSDDKRPHSGCPCVSCDRKDCRGVVKKTEIVKECECKPCDCVKYSEIPKTPCDCEPCHCAECTTSFRGPKQVILAHMQESLRPNICQCEPCECLNCTHNYTSMANVNTRQETSTNISYVNCQCGNCSNDVCQLDREVCRCDQNRVMRKPIEKSNRDYDIHTTFTNKQQNSSKYYNKYDTYAMFAVAENYSNTLYKNKERKKSCQCTDCECMICDDKENIGNRYITTQNNLSYDIFDDNCNSCKCLPCECKVCTVNRYAERNLLRMKTFNRTCNCTMCECIICERLNCDGDSLRNEIDSNFGDKVPRDILRKGNIAAPFCFENKISLPSCIKSQSSDGLQRLMEKKVHLKISTEISNRNMLDQSLTYHHSESKHIDSNSFKQHSSENLAHPNKVSSLNNTAFVKTFSNISKHNMKLHKTSENSNLFINLHSVCDITRKSLNDTELCKQSFSVTEDFPHNNIILTNDAISKSLQKRPQKDINRKIEYFPKIKVPTLTELKKYDIKDYSSRITDTEFYKNPSILNKPSMLSIFKSSSKSLTVCTKLSTTLNNEEPKDELNFKLDETYTSQNNITLNPLQIPHELTNYNGINYLMHIENSLKSNTSTNLEVKNSNTKSVHRVDSINCNEQSQKSQIKQKSRNKPNKMYCRPIKRSQVGRTKKKSKEIKDPNTLKENVIQINKSKDKLLHNDVVTSVNSFFDSQFNLLKKIKMEIQDMEMDSTNNSVLRKNLYLNYEKAKQNKSVWTISDIKNDVQRNVESVSSQVDDYYDVLHTGNTLIKPDLVLKNVYDNATSQTLAKKIQVEKETNCNLLETLENLKESMRSYLEQALAHAVVAPDDTKIKQLQSVGWDIPNFHPVKSSCQALKAKFVGVKRISARTVLVRWEIPQDLSYIKGYELQVDGRAIQKIFSPMRSVAVITSLPHSDKLLLTIRTITISDIPLDHYPASTMVYRSRCK